MNTYDTVSNPLPQLTIDTIADILTNYHDIKYEPLSTGGIISYKDQSSTFRWKITQKRNGTRTQTIASQSKVWDVLRSCMQFANDYPKHDYTLKVNKVNASGQGPYSDTYSFSAMVRITKCMYVIPVLERYWSALGKLSDIEDSIKLGINYIELDHTLIASDYSIDRHAISNAIRELITLGIFKQTKLGQNRRKYGINWRQLALKLEPEYGRLPPIFTDKMVSFNGKSVKMITWDMITDLLGFNNVTETTIATEPPPKEPFIGGSGFIVLVKKWTTITQLTEDEITRRLRTIGRTLAIGKPTIAYTQSDYDKIDNDMAKQWRLDSFSIEIAKNEYREAFLKAFPDRTADLEDTVERKIEAMLRRFNDDNESGYYLTEDWKPTFANMSAQHVRKFASGFSEAVKAGISWQLECEERIRVRESEKAAKQQRTDGEA